MQRNLVSQSASRIQILILTFLLLTFMATHAALASSPCEAWPLGSTLTAENSKPHSDCLAYGLFAKVSTLDKRIIV